MEFFGIDVSGWDPEYKRAVYESLPRAEAIRIRRQLITSPVELSSEQVYWLRFAETDSKEQAEKAEREHIRAMLMAGRTPR